MANRPESRWNYVHGKHKSHRRKRPIRRPKRRKLMPPAIVTFAVSAFLSGAVIAVFVFLVASIHATDRRHHLTAAPDSRLDALARHLLGVGVRTGDRPED